jgi:hypothetical protein
MYTPNPTRLEDGSWKTHTGTIEVTTNVKAHERDAFKRALRELLIEFGGDGEVEFVEESLH